MLKSTDKYINTQLEADAARGLWDSLAMRFDPHLNVWTQVNKHIQAELGPANSIGRVVWSEVDDSLGQDS